MHHLKCAETVVDKSVHIFPTLCNRIRKSLVGHYEGKSPQSHVPPWHQHVKWRHNERDGVSNHQPRCFSLFHTPTCSPTWDVKQSTIVYSTVYSGADQRKHQSSASLAFVREIHRWLVNSPHKGPVTWKMFSFDDVIMTCLPHHCPACRTTLVATRFRVAVICPIIQVPHCIFSFILFDLCLLITFFNFIMNYVPIVTFWIFTYHKIWILSIMFCFIWIYWIIYFLACLEVSWRVVS